MKTRIRNAISDWKTKHTSSIIHVGRLLRIPDKHIVAFLLSDISTEELDFDIFVGQVVHVLQTIAKNRKLAPHDYYLYKQFIDCIEGKLSDGHIRQMFVRPHADYRQNPRNIREAFIDMLLEQGHVSKPEAEELKGLIA